MFAIIIAIVAAVLSLAAPVRVEAQTPSVSLNKIGQTWYDYVGLTPGATLSYGSCFGASSHPAACSFDSKGNAAGGGPRIPCGSWTPSGEGARLFAVHGVPTSSTLQNPYGRHALYSDSTCSTEIAAVTYTYPTSLPVFRVRDITSDSATIDIQDAFETHMIPHWSWRLTPGDGACMNTHDPRGNPLAALGESNGRTIVIGGITDFNEASPETSLSGLSADTTYTFDIYPANYTGRNLPCLARDKATSVTFTTLPSPPGPPPPSNPTAQSDGAGRVTVAWERSEEPGVAGYEYRLQQGEREPGAWRRVPGSNADTTSVTIDLTTGAARVSNLRSAAAPMVQWTISVRAVNAAGEPGTLATVKVEAAAAATVPAVPLAGLATLALLLFLSGKRRWNG